MLSLDFLFSKTKYLSHISGEEWVIEDSEGNYIYDINGNYLNRISKRTSFDKTEYLYKIIGWTWLIEDKVWSPIVKNGDYVTKHFLHFKTKSLVRTTSAGINYILHENYFDAEKFKKSIFRKWGEEAQIKEDKDFLLIKDSNNTYKILPTLPPIDLRKNKYVIGADMAESHKIASQTDICIGIHKNKINDDYINHYLKLTIDAKKTFIEQWSRKNIRYESEEELTNLLTILVGSGYTVHIGKNTYSKSIRIHSNYIPNKYSFRGIYVNTIKFETFLDSLKTYVNKMSAVKLMKNSTYGACGQDSFKLYSNPCDEIPLFYIRNDGKFGIGNPTAKLHIRGIAVDGKKTENDINEEIISKQYTLNYHKCDVNLGMDTNILLL